jgi:hypothetical protein
MFKMKLDKYISLLFLLFLLGGCSKVRVSQDYNPSFLFNSAESFNWNTRLAETDIPERQKDNELLDKRFHEAIESTLLRSGLSLAERPDLLISYTYSVVSKLETNSLSTGFGFGYGSYGRYRGAGIHTGSNLRQYDQGMLVISIHSGKTEELVWRGVGTREVFTHSSPESVTRAVVETVETILRQFPPR